MAGIIIVLICIALFAIFLTKGYNESSRSANSTDTSSVIEESFQRAISDDHDVYKNKRLTIELKGVGPYYDREEAFDSVDEGDEIFLDWDPDNEYDNDAIGCYNEEGDLIGYLPSGRQKIIETFYTSKFLARVYKKSIEPSPKYGEYFRMKVTIWMGFPEDELESIKSKWK
jgi:hypothetical protein